MKRIGGRHAATRWEPKLCPTCLNAMKQVGDGWECPKHGPPSKP